MNEKSFIKCYDLLPCGCPSGSLALENPVTTPALATHPSRANSPLGPSFPLQVRVYRCEECQKCRVRWR